MKVYRVAVTEIYRKVVSVEAHNEREAHQRTWDAWNNTEIILEENDFAGAEMDERNLDRYKGFPRFYIRV